MIREEYKPRIIDDIIEKYLINFGAICIEGPKWCGKTWTSSFYSNSAIYLGDPSGNFQNRNLAQISPDIVCILSLAILPAPLCKIPLCFGVDEPVKINWPFFPV